jgi:hypothetical protein
MGSQRPDELGGRGRAGCSDRGRADELDRRGESACRLRGRRRSPPRAVLPARSGRRQLRSERPDELGGRATPRSRIRAHKLGRYADPGDVGAWRLPGGLYLQAIGSSGNARIFRQASGRPVTPVTVPRTGGDNWILASRGGWLLLTVSNLCADSTSLLWFNPSTYREQFLIRPPRRMAGLLGAVPYGQPTVPSYVQADC